MKKILTLCIVHQGDTVLLGYKKRGFGKDLWNGFGGKVDPHETIRDAAIRETKEEAHITPIELQQVGILNFNFIETNEFLEVHIFKCTKYEGEVGESEEMRPQWFDVTEIPFREMWKDDIFWFDLFLNDKKFMGTFEFDAQNEIVNHELQTITEFP